MRRSIKRERRRAAYLHRRARPTVTITKSEPAVSDKPLMPKSWLEGLVKNLNEPERKLDVTRVRISLAGVEIDPKTAGEGSMIYVGGGVVQKLIDAGLVVPPSEAKGSKAD